MTTRSASSTIHSAVRSAQRRGASLLELVIVAAVIALLVGALLNRIAWYQQQAELAGTRQVVLALRGALRLQASVLLARDGGEQGLTALSKQNPMTWLARAPMNYVGEYYSPIINNLPKGTWCYDKGNKILMYLPSHAENVTGSASSMMKYKVKLLKTISEPGKSKVADRIVLEQITG